MKLKVYLAQHRISVTAFAKRIRMTRQGIHLLLSGKVQRPTVETIKKIEAGTNGMVTVEDFYPKCG